MTLYDSPEGVAQYVEIADGIDGRRLVEALGRHVPVGASVLELGSGPGKDLLLLAERFEVFGTDRSQAFVDLVRSRHPEIAVGCVDAVDLASTELASRAPFDAIYSNKVLHHLELDELRQSFARQASVLRPGGVALHSFWPGDQRSEVDGLLFQQHTPESLAPLYEGVFELVERFTYDELGYRDSLCVVLRRRS